MSYARGRVKIKTERFAKAEFEEQAREAKLLVSQLEEASMKLTELATKAREIGLTETSDTISKANWTLVDARHKIRSAVPSLRFR